MHKTNVFLVRVAVLAVIGVFAGIGVVHAAGIVPTYANNGASCGNTWGNLANSYTCSLPNTAGAGNAIVVFGQWDTPGVTATVTDNAGDTYTKVACLGNDSEVCGYVALNVSSTARAVTLNMSKAETYTSVAVYEFYNVASVNAIDGSCTGASTASSASCSSGITPTAANDLVLFWASADGGSSQPSYWTAGASPWVLKTADDYDNTGMEYQVDPTTSTITPSMGIGLSEHSSGVGFALKSASTTTGTPPPTSGIHINYLQHDSVFNAPTGNTLKFQFPCSGDLIVPMWLGAGGYDITGMTDSAANVYKDVSPIFSASGGGDIETWYAANASCNATDTITATTNSFDSAGNTLELYDVSGAATAPFDMVATSTGDQTKTGNLTTETIAPSTQNGLVLWMLSVESHTMIGLASPIGAAFDAALTNPNILISPPDENSGVGHLYNSATSSETWISLENADAVQWASMATAFKAGSSTPDTTPPSVPQNLTATATSPSEINLAWSASTDNVGVAGYQVFRNSVQIATTTNTAYADMGLTASTTYVYTVDAFDAAANISSQSSPASATTLTPDIAPPTVSITNPADGAIVSSTVIISATASDNVAVAGVQFQLDGTNLGSEVTVSPYQVSWNTTSAGNGAHDITATAFDTSNNTSTASISVTVANPPVITGVSTTGITTSTATITWTTANEPANSQIAYGTSTAYGFLMTLDPNFVTNHSEPLTGLTASTLYHYAVYSVDANGNVAASGDNTFTTQAPPDTTPPTIPQGLTATPVSSSQINLAWASSTDNVGVAGYQVFRNTIQIATTTNTAFSDTGLTASTTYAYTVLAFDAAGNLSALSSPANATTLGVPPVSFIQGAASLNDGSSKTIAQAFASNVQAGDLIAVAISWGNSSAVTCKDSLGNTFAVAATEYDKNNDQSLAICYAANSKAGADTVTATFGSSVAWRRILVHEYKGIATTSPVDVSAEATSTGTAVTSGVAITTVPNDLVFGDVENDTGATTVTSGTGFAKRESLSDVDDTASEDLIQAVPGSTAITFTFAASETYLAQMVAFKAAH